MLSAYSWGQDVAYNDIDISYAEAHDLAYNGKHSQAQNVALGILKQNPQNTKARTLVARTYSWFGQYDKARREFNVLTSEDKNNQDIWILAVKNELYAQNNATALGLANKAIRYIKTNKELERLREMALDRIENQDYDKKSWMDNSSTVTGTKNSTFTKKKTSKTAKKSTEDTTRLFMNFARHPTEKRAPPLSLGQ